MRGTSWSHFSFALSPCRCLLSCFLGFFLDFCFLSFYFNFCFFPLISLSIFFLRPSHKSFHFFLCCIALPSYDWLLVPEAVLHTLSAPADLLSVLWCTFPFFLSPLPSLFTSSRVLLTLFANKVLSKQSSHGCWLSADRLTCEWAQND